MRVVPPRIRVGEAVSAPVVVPSGSGGSGAVTAPGRDGRPCEVCGQPLPDGAPARRRYCFPPKDCGELARLIGNRERFEEYRAQNAAYLDWNRRLRAAGVPVGVRNEAIGALRGRGHVDPATVRSELAARGWIVGPRNALRREPVVPAVPVPVAAVAPVTPVTTVPTTTAPDVTAVAPKPTVPALLPCAALDITLSTGVDFGTVRLLHGLLSMLHGTTHRKLHPWWSLVPLDNPTMWRVLWCDVEIAERLRGTVTKAHLGVKPITVRWSPTLHRPRVPQELPEGEYLVTLDTLTPVSFARGGHKEAVTRPTPQTLRSAARTLIERAGMEHRRDLTVHDVSSQTQVERIDVGGHYYRGSGRGEVVAFTGSVVARCNARAAWWLQLSAVYGLGGLTSLGFGRVKVSVTKVVR